MPPRQIHNSPAASGGRSYADRDLKLLWGLAAAHCSKPDCRRPVVAQASAKDPEAVLGEIAHIVAFADDGPRGDSSYPAAQRNKYENLILLCPTDHALVDKQDSTYSISDLRDWKKRHEAWVVDRLKEAVPQVGFAELEVVTRALVAAAALPATDFAVLDPTEKMLRNSLTSRVRFELTLGLSKAHEVEDFVVHVGHFDPDFPERLKSGFVAEYRRLVEVGVGGDSLFSALTSFAASGHGEFRFQAAGLIVLAYLFEKCEVFER